VSKSHRLSDMPVPPKEHSEKTKPKPRAKTFTARNIDPKDALKDLAVRFDRAKELVAQLREQRVVSQAFLDREVSI